ncbi:MAG: sugar phosphate isomerase/epimerase [Candidatus Latescibacterota bacterium]|jgi:sugar phosphate isomerase/epimerase
MTLYKSDTLWGRMMAQLTVLNSMAGVQVEACMDQHVAWGLRVLDLKDRLFGKAVAQLNRDEAVQISQMATARNLSIHTLSTGLFHSDIEVGEVAFRKKWMPILDDVIQVANILNPHQVRLLMAMSSKRLDVLDSSVYLSACHPWVFEVYREAVDRVVGAGFGVVIENEVKECLFSRPPEIISFFDVLDRRDAVSLIWDVQNLWQMGTFPSVAVYDMLKPVIGMIHVKGGRAELPGGALVWKAGLKDASWPVVPILKAAIAGGVSPVICLNGSHGEKPDGYVEDTVMNLKFLRDSIKEIE